MTGKNNGGMTLKKFILLGSLAIGVFSLVACSNQDIYNGSELDIGVVGEVPDNMLEVGNHNLMITSMSTMEEVRDNHQLFDAVMITPGAFNEASEDEYVNVFQQSEVPIIFYDSEKRHFPFVTEGMTYETATWDSLDNGSHTTMYLNDAEGNMEKVWYFHSEGKKDLDKLLKDLFEKVESL